MIHDDLTREWEVAHPVHVISWALLDHVIAWQCNKESLFQELTCPARPPATDVPRRSHTGSPAEATAGVLVSVCRATRCLHKCWFCFPKMFSSAFSCLSPSLVLHLLVPSWLPTLSPFHHLFQSHQITEWISTHHPGIANRVSRLAAFKVSGCDFNDWTPILTE